MLLWFHAMNYHFSTRNVFCYLLLVTLQSQIEQSAHCVSVSLSVQATAHEQNDLDVLLQVYVGSTALVLHYSFIIC